MFLPTLQFLSLLNFSLPVKEAHDDAHSYPSPIHPSNSPGNIGDEWLEKVWTDSTRPFGECMRREEIYS